MVVEDSCQRRRPLHVCFEYFRKTGRREPRGAFGRWCGSASGSTGCYYLFTGFLGVGSCPILLGTSGTRGMYTSPIHCFTLLLAAITLWCLSSYPIVSPILLPSIQLSQAVHSAQLNDKIRRWKHELEVMNVSVDMFDSLENRIEASLRGNPY